MKPSVLGKSFKSDSEKTPKEETVSFKKPPSVGKKDHLSIELMKMFGGMSEENKKKLVAIAIILG